MNFKFLYIILYLIKFDTIFVQTFFCYPAYICCNSFIAKADTNFKISQTGLSCKVDNNCYCWHCNIQNTTAIFLLYVHTYMNIPKTCLKVRKYCVSLFNFFFIELKIVLTKNINNWTSLKTYANQVQKRAVSFFLCNKIFYLIWLITKANASKRDYRIIHSVNFAAYRSIMELDRRSTDYAREKWKGRVMPQLTWLCWFCSAMAFSLACLLHLYLWFWNHIFTCNNKPQSERRKNNIDAFFEFLTHTQTYFVVLRACATKQSFHLVFYIFIELK